MSYDLQVWSAKVPELSSVLSPIDAWLHTEGTSLLRGRGWTITIEHPVRVFDEDVPTEVANEIPGVAFLTEIQLSPIGENGSGRRALSKVAASIAKVSHGVISDPQTNKLICVRGVKRLVPLGVSCSATLVEMSWWFDSGPLANRDVNPLLDALEKTLPEALPRRYGDYEPPQYVYAETGREGFARFAADNSNILTVWYSSAQVADVGFLVPKVFGGSRNGYRSGHLSISIDADVLSQPGWNTAFQRAWLAVSNAVQPFFGDVRHLRGYERNRGRYWSSSTTERHPVRSWFWTGVPGGEAIAAVIGDPYRDLWPGFCDGARHTEEGLCFRWQNDWVQRAGDVLQQALCPKSILMRGGWELEDFKYAEVWPFDEPYDKQVW